MSDAYFNKLKSLVNEGRLFVQLIVAPPRTNSSMLEHSLGNSPDIAHECHEPFLGARNAGFDSDHGYQLIYETIGGDEFDRSGGNTSVVVKEMAHWLIPNEEYKRFAEITDKPIIILIRNPLLSVESRIRRVLSTLDMRSTPRTQKFLLDAFAKRKGFDNWMHLAEKFVDEENINGSLDFLRSETGDIDFDRLYNTPSLSVQNELLDDYARQYEYVNWRDLLNKKLYDERDFAFFENIFLSNPERLSFEQSEFSALRDEIRFFEGAGKEVIVVDTTDLPAVPEIYLRHLCEKIGIAFDPKMVDWGDEPVDFHSEQTQEFEKTWYDALRSSSRIQPPHEIPPTLASFPKFITDYLQDTNLAVYAELSQRKEITGEIKEALREQRIKLYVTEATRQRLISLGVIEPRVHTGLVSIPLKDIDPIHAITTDRELYRDPGFRQRNIAYLSELMTVENFLREQAEPTRELRKQVR